MQRIALPLVVLAATLGTGGVPAARHVRASPPAAPTRNAAVQHALLVSVDGLRSDALLALPPAELPAFARLRAGASTLNARCDPDLSITLPNHTSMVTGRPVLGDAGHAWTRNGEEPPENSLHANKGRYVASVFDVAHDHGWRTALVTGKPKFALYDHSYDAQDGAPDTHPPDDGRDKLDSYVFTLDPDEFVDGVLRELGDGARKTFVFVHFAAPDLTAHKSGWDVTPDSKYMRAVKQVDAGLGRILAAIDAAEGLRGRTAIVLTADHGGGAPFKSHDQAGMWIDYIIPFVVWSGEAARGELYELNLATRKDPSLANPAIGAPGLPPVRNGEAGNVVLQLLGLPAIPGSVFDAAQDLVLR